jgi:hypothetical protein
MKFAKKYYMIEPQTYEDLKFNRGMSKETYDGDPFTHPDVKVAKAEAKNMKKLSLASELSDYDKLIQHSEALQRYLNHFQKAVTIPRKQALVGTPVQFEEETPKSVESTKLVSIPKKEMTDEKYSVQNILLGVTDERQRKATTNILERLRRAPNIAWNEKTGRVNINGSSLRGSDITSLLRNVVSQQPQSTNSKNYHKFKKALIDIGALPKTSIKKQVGGGVVKPMRHFPHRTWYRLSEE